MALFPPYSTTFVSGLLNSAVALTYTVPAGRTAIISCVTAFKAAAATPTDVAFIVQPTGSASVAYFWFSSMVGTTKLESQLWVGHLALPAGGQMFALRSTTGTSSAYVTMSGYLLTG